MLLAPVVVLVTLRRAVVVRVGLGRAVVVLVTLGRAVVVIVTLGLFLVVINAGLLWTTDKLIDGFEIDSLFSTLIASVMISTLDIVFRWILPWV